MATEPDQSGAGGWIEVKRLSSWRFQATLHRPCGHDFVLHGLDSTQSAAERSGATCMARTVCDDCRAMGRTRVAA